MHEPIDAFVETPLGYGGLHHVSPDYAIHYNPGYYVPVHPPPVHHDQLFSYEEYQHEQKSGDKKTHEKESGDRKKQSIMSLDNKLSLLFIRTKSTPFVV